MRKILSILIGSLFICSISTGQFIQLKNRSGVVIEAKILNYQNGKVKLQRSDGVTFVVSTSIFDQASQLLIEQQAKELSSSSSINSANPSNTSRTAASKIPFGKLNDAVGQKLFKDNNLWDDTPDEVSGRLNWPVESATSNSISCRLYAAADYNFLSVRPYSAVFYGSAENISSFSLVFANKGDCFAAAGVAEEHFKNGSVTNDPAE
jgi:hypothetical protein